MKSLGLAITVSAITWAGVGAAAPIEFYFGDSYDPDQCSIVHRGGYDEADCTAGPEGHELDVTVKGWSVENDYFFTDPLMNPLRSQRDMDSIGHDGLAVGHMTKNQGTDEAKTLHFEHDVRLINVTFSNVDHNDDAIVSVLNDLSIPVDPIYEFNIQDEGTNRFVKRNGDPDLSRIIVTFENLIGKDFIFSTTQDNGGRDNDNWSVKYATFEKIEKPPAVPLPAAGWMLLAGLGGLAAMKRKRKAA